MRCFYKDETMMADGFGGGSREIITPADACGAGGDWCGVCVPTFSRAAREKALKRLQMEEITRVVNTNGDPPVYLLQREGKKIAFAMALVGAVHTRSGGSWVKSWNTTCSLTAFVRRRQLRFE